MLIDWFTVGAQATNFILLVWLMKRFLYRPILSAIDARETRIASEMAGAEAKRTEAEKEREAYQRKNEEWDRQRAALLSQASTEATLERQRLLEEARQAADALTVKRQEMLQNDARNLSEAITRRTEQEVFAIARKVLKELASESLEDRVLDAFVGRLRAMDGPSTSKLAGMLRGTSLPIVVHSAFDLTERQRMALKRALEETFAVGVPTLRFEATSNVIGGIELLFDGHKTAFSIAEHLDTLQKSVADILNQQLETERSSPIRESP